MVLAHGVTINGLPIMIRLGWSGGLYSTAGLDLFYEDCIIGGPGAFIIVAKSRALFADAIKRKLILEIIAARTHSEVLRSAASPMPPSASIVSWAKREAVEFFPQVTPHRETDRSSCLLPYPEEVGPASPSNTSTLSSLSRGIQFVPDRRQRQRGENLGAPPCEPRNSTML
jgi:hypothetical protein